MICAGGVLHSAQYPASTIIAPVRGYLKGQFHLAGTPNQVALDDCGIPWKDWGGCPLAIRQSKLCPLEIWDYKPNPGLLVFLFKFGVDSHEHSLKQKGWGSDST